MVTKDSDFDPAGYYLLGEACRTADIIERLSGMLSASSTHWIALSEEAARVAMLEAGNVVEINLAVNPVLGEIRQQRLALRQLLAQLKLGTTKAVADTQSELAKLMAGFSDDSDD